MKALIDADVVTYRCGFASQATLYKITHNGKEHTFENKADLNKYMAYMVSDGDTVEVSDFIEAEPVENALHSVKLVLQDILNQTKAEDYAVMLSGDSNFRDEIATIKGYKANRDRAKRPVHYDAIRDYLIHYWNAEIHNGIEADDALGIAQCAALLVGKDTVVCTIDKDLDQIPGWHYNFVDGALYYVNEEEARRNLWEQILTGDSTDNIQGCPGIGKKKAERILEHCNTDQEFFCEVGKCYAGASHKGVSYDDPEDALYETAHLVYIWRRSDDVWMPPIEV